MTGLYYYNMNIGHHVLRCKVFVKGQLDELSEITCQILKIYEKSGFSWVNEGELHTLEKEFMTEIKDPNEAIKEIL